MDLRVPRQVVRYHLQVSLPDQVQEDLYLIQNSLELRLLVLIYGQEYQGLLLFTIGKARHDHHTWKFIISSMLESK